MKYDMRSSITLQSRASGQNPIGNQSESYVNVATFFAAYVPNNGRMYNGGSQLHTESDCEFRTRYSSFPQQGMYVLFNNNRYLIQVVEDMGGLHRETRIVCKLEK
jgi:SPP1 family predicted phage head-tail adaptor